MFEMACHVEDDVARAAQLSTARGADPTPRPPDEQCLCQWRVSPSMHLAGGALRDLAAHLVGHPLISLSRASRRVPKNGQGET